MINKKYLWIIFGLMVAAQLFIPAQMIWNSEKTISKGHTYKFKTIPIDPVDPFRGKYIRLRFEVENKDYDTKYHDNKLNGNTRFALLEEIDGYASISKVINDPPQDNRSYIKVNTSPWKNGKVRVDLPFDKFFMEESLAKPAEDTVRKLLRDSTVIVYAEISVLDGNAVLKEVMINDQSIADYVRESNIEIKK